VESNGVKELMNGIEPKFKVPCRITLQKDYIKLYEKEKLRFNLISFSSITIEAKIRQIKIELHTSFFSLSFCKSFL
jgi:hypothetical protein